MVQPVLSSRKKNDDHFLSEWNAHYEHEIGRMYDPLNIHDGLDPYHMLSQGTAVLGEKAFPTLSPTSSRCLYPAH